MVSIRNIQFQYDPATKSGICGPVKLNGRATKVRAVKTLPATMEFGGTVRFSKGALIPIASAKKNKAGGKYYVVTKPFIKTYRARPFMGPALERETAAGTILDSWKGQIHG